MPDTDTLHGVLLPGDDQDQHLLLLTSAGVGGDAGAWCEPKVHPMAVHDGGGGSKGEVGSPAVGISKPARTSICGYARSPHRNLDVLSHDGRCKERVKVPTRARERCPAVHIFPRGIVCALLSCECCHVLIVNVPVRVYRFAPSLNTNAMDRHDAPGVDSHPLPGHVWVGTPRQS
eukprot:scaffold34277_cov63-Phaeocystis_antarctica.AAC.1